MKKIAVVGLVSLVAASSWAVVGTIKPKNGEAQKGEVKWSSVSKSYSIETKKGVNVQYALDKVESIDIVKPANLDKLVELVSKGQGASAEKGLSDIVSTYKMLQWDRPAASALIDVYLQTKRPQKAYDLAQSIIKEDNSSAYDGAMAPSYWQALLELNKTQQLENCLRTAVAKGGRASSAEALIMRGDIIMHDGAASQEACRKALKDSYLRVALMYNDAESVLPRRKALLKCADAFDKLGRSDIGQRMRTDAEMLAK